MVIYFCIKFQENISPSFQVTSGLKYITEVTIFKVQRAPSLGLRFLCTAARLMMLYICVKFHQNIWNGSQLTERTRVHSRNGYFQYLLCLKCRNFTSIRTAMTQNSIRRSREIKQRRGSLRRIIFTNSCFIHDEAVEFCTSRTSSNLHSISLVSMLNKSNVQLM